MLVHFYVQKSSSFSAMSATIPFEVAVLNIGNAMDIKSGVFIAPVGGRYFFGFSAYSSGSVGLFIHLNLNGVSVGSLQTQTAWTTTTSKSTLNLKKGDEIKLTIAGQSLYDDDNHYTHFTGILLDQDIFN
jgi:hypothetical protein